MLKSVQWTRFRKVHLLTLFSFKVGLGLISISEHNFHIPFPAKGRINYSTVYQTAGPGIDHDMDWADNLIVDYGKDKYGNFWQGPRNTLPQGFTLKLSGDISLDHIVVRNGKTTPWKCGTKDFEILIGRTSNGPWKSVLNDSMENTLSPPTPWDILPDLKRFDIADNTNGKYMKFVCHSHHPTHVDADSYAPRCSLQYLAIYGSQCFNWC